MGLVGGRYEIAERIGGGGMADVFRAHDRAVDRDVALKVMRAAFVGDAEFVERFHREAEALASIEHPNIVRVLDYGASEDGPFIAMELVSGGTLRDLMRARSRVDQYMAAQIAAGIADGLEAAHIRGVLHRDLKPDNVLLDGDGRPKIADFGIARLAATTAITRTGEVLGTPQYLAPEQIAGDVVDERADVYALGVILYEMLTGEQPTGGTTPSEIVSRRLRAEPRPPSRLVALTPAMNTLVLRALARDPARRFSRASYLRAALLAIKPPTPRAPSNPRVIMRPPSLAPVLATLALLAAFIHDSARGFRRAAALLVVAVHNFVRRVRLVAVVRAADLRAGLVAIKPPTPPVTSRARVAPRRRRSPATLTAALALVAALVGGGLIFAGVRPVAVAPAEVPTATPATSVLASTSSPAATAQPSTTAIPTAEPTAEPTAAPTVAPTPAPVVAAAVSGDPEGTIVSFYQLISGHDYASASGLWSDRMRATYPPQTNIWGRFDATSSIVTRSAWVTSATPGSAAVAVDLIETLRNGTVRRWVGTWYLVRSGSGWLLDQPGLRPA